MVYVGRAVKNKSAASNFFMKILTIMFVCFAILIILVKKNKKKGFLKAYDYYC